VPILLVAGEAFLGFHGGEQLKLGAAAEETVEFNHRLFFWIIANVLRHKHATPLVSFHNRQAIYLLKRSLPSFSALGNKASGGTWQYMKYDWNYRFRIGRIVIAKYLIGYRHFK
jgi:hypothetical protein